MSDKLFDKLDELEDEEEVDTSKVNETLDDDAEYWQSRNQIKKAEKAVSDDDDS